MYGLERNVNSVDIKMNKLWKGYVLTFSAHARLSNLEGLGIGIYDVQEKGHQGGSTSNIMGCG